MRNELISFVMVKLGYIEQHINFKLVLIKTKSSVRSLN